MKKIASGIICLFSFCAMNAMNIQGLEKKEVLKALYAVAKPTFYGKNSWGYRDDNNLTDEEIKLVEKNDWYIDYLNGRLMKIDLSGDKVDTWSFNRDNGKDAAENAIKKLKN